MDKKLKLPTLIGVNASIEKVWFALTDKETIKQYFWGTETNTDWKEEARLVSLELGKEQATKTRDLF